ncbi:hypothetical protein L1887_03491 [Cichorium endivia]|nr:hypothetical protein L1887_03491 [Cichorium endivia]
MRNGNERQKPKGDKFNWDRLIQRGRVCTGYIVFICSYRFSIYSKLACDWILIPTSFNSFSFSLKGEEIPSAFWFLLDLRDSNSSRGSFRYWSERQCCWIKK